LNALGFYQKRGFELVAVYRGAVNESRKRKPSIPLTGYNNIPLRDEIELEIIL
jgi:DNA-3-methyladenine glycosylase I